MLFINKMYKNIQKNTAKTSKKTRAVKALIS